MTSKTYYDSIRNSADPCMVLTTGTPADRLLGLEPLLAEALGRAVLDIGSHVGVVAEAFARAGASIIHGVDFYQPGLAQARTRLLAYPTQTLFEQCDLSLGSPALEKALPNALASYDIVLYLGVHHHLARQMSPDAATQLVVDLQARAGEFFAVRTPDEIMLQLHAQLSRQFEVWHLREKDDRPVSQLRIYKRTQRAR